jgi:hypothetical protein
MSQVETLIIRENPHYQLGHAPLGLDLITDEDTKGGQVLLELLVDSLIITGIAIGVYPGGTGG